MLVPLRAPSLNTTIVQQDLSAAQRPHNLQRGVHVRLVEIDRLLREGLGVEHELRAQHAVLGQLEHVGRAHVGDEELRLGRHEGADGLGAAGVVGGEDGLALEDWGAEELKLEEGGEVRGGPVEGRWGAP